MKTVYGYTSTQQTTQRALLNERSVLVYVLGPTGAGRAPSSGFAPFFCIGTQAVGVRMRSPAARAAAQARPAAAVPLVVMKSKKVRPRQVDARVRVEHSP